MDAYEALKAIQDEVAVSKGMPALGHTCEHSGRKAALIKRVEAILEEVVWWPEG